MLGALTAGVVWACRRERPPFPFRLMPLPFWCYFLPMVLTTTGLTPAQSPLYDAFAKYLLPASLVLLLIGTDLRAMAGLGRKALLVMLAGSLGIIVGGPTVLLLFRSHLPEGAWKGIGALSGSWIGGSSNMLALKESLGTPDAIFAPLVITDVVVAYGWMAILIALSKHRARIDHWLGAEPIVLEKVVNEGRETKNELTPFRTFLLLILGFAIGYTCYAAGQRLPKVGTVLSPTAWSLILVTSVSLILSLTRVSRLESWGASRVGTHILLLLLTSLGAKASLAALREAPVFVLAGVVWVLIHAVFLIIAGKWLRAPLFLLATASQANVGGPVSTPIVAATYEPALASFGVLLAVLGNVLGTYGGLLCAYLCQKVSF